MARWNGSHSARWNRLRTALRREYPGLEFFRGVEVQGRGALHDHVLLWSRVALSRREVKRLAMLAGFGHALDLAECEPGSKKASYYVSKYVTKATDLRGDVPWWGQVVDYETGEVTEGLVDDARYRTWSMSRHWGLTMAAVRRSAAEYAAGKREAELSATMAEFAAAFASEWVVLDPSSETPPAPS